MAPKIKSEASSSLTIPETTNYLTIPSENEANTRYKCFVCFLNSSYLNGALFKNPTLYIDILEAFWRTATCNVIALEDGSSKTEINYDIGGKQLMFGETEVNVALSTCQQSILMRRQLRFRWWNFWNSSIMLTPSIWPS